MNEKEQSVVEAAFKVIQRYGVRRTTMCDISDEAGISRQTLYSMFPSKEEMLRATIRWYTDQTLGEISRGCSQARSLEEALDILFEHLVRQPRKMMDTSPDSADIVEGFNEAAREEVELACSGFRRMFADVLSPYEKQIVDCGLTVDRLSDYLQNATHCIKTRAKNTAHLKDMLGVLKALTLGVVKNNP